MKTKIISVLFVLLIISTGCNEKVATNKEVEEISKLEAQIKELNQELLKSKELISNLEVDLESLKSDNTELNKTNQKLSTVKDEIESLNITLANNKEIINSLNNDVSELTYIINDLEIDLKNTKSSYINAFSSSADLYYKPDFDEKKEWTNVLEEAIRFLPDFNSMEEIKDNDLLEPLYLYAVHSSDYFEFESNDYITDNELDNVSIKLLGKNIKKHQSFEFVDYIDGKYYADGFSFHGSMISDVKHILSYNDLYILEVDLYGVGEDEWFEIYDSIDSVLKAIETNTNKPSFFGSYLIVLRLDNIKDKEDFKLEAKIKMH